MNTYVAGSLVRVATYSGSVSSPLGGFKDNTGTLNDPAVVTLKYRPAGGVETTVTYPSAPIVRDSAGLYHADLDTTGSATTAPVIWQYVWAGTGGVQAIAQQQFEVTPPYLP